MPQELVHKDGRQFLRDMSPELIAQEAVDRSNAAAMRARRQVVVDRRRAIGASAVFRRWEEALVGKTFDEITAMWASATPQDKDEIALYLLLLRALQVR